MKLKSVITIITLILIFIILVIILIINVRVPLSSVEQSYINDKILRIFNISFLMSKPSRDIFGNLLFEEISYKPEFYLGGITTDYESFMRFIKQETNVILLKAISNTFNFSELSKIIGRLGLTDEDMFEISTNVLNLYIDKISEHSFDSLIMGGEAVDKNIFYNHSEKFINGWVDASAEISEMEISISKEIDTIKKEMENLINNFREETYSYYVNVSRSKRNIKSIDIFIKELDGEIKYLKSELTSHQKRIDDIFSKLSILREGYKIAWDEKVNIIKKNPEKYISRYISDFPIYVIRKLMKYNLLGIPEVMYVKDVEYRIVHSNNTFIINVIGKWNDNDFKFDGFFSNSVWGGTVKLGNIERNLGIDNIEATFSVIPFADTLGGEYKYNVKVEGGDRKNIFKTLFTNQNFVEKVISELTSEKGFVSMFVEEEVDNLLRSYKEQFDRYKVGIIKDTRKIFDNFRIKVEKSKIKLKKSIEGV
ncbi:MAG: hypothetical protein N2712_03835 [Brevinematales bacterium]|nr:hypothetical protein [Brevinematales bacterium]